MKKAVSILGRFIIAAIIMTGCGTTTKTTEEPMSALPESWSLTLTGYELMEMQLDRAESKLEGIISGAKSGRVSGSIEGNAVKLSVVLDDGTALNLEGTAFGKNNMSGAVTDEAGEASGGWAATRK